MLPNKKGKFFRPEKGVRQCQGKRIRKKSFKSDKNGKKENCFLPELSD